MGREVRQTSEKRLRQRKPTLISIQREEFDFLLQLSSLPSHKHDLITGTRRFSTSEGASERMERKSLLPIVAIELAPTTNPSPKEI